MCRNDGARRTARTRQHRPHGRQGESSLSHHHHTRSSVSHQGIQHHRHAFCTLQTHIPDEYSPPQVEHLILVCPAGVGARPDSWQIPPSMQNPWTLRGQMVRLAHRLWDAGATPGGLIRTLGPWGPNLIQRYARNRYVKGLGTAVLCCAPLHICLTCTALVGHCVGVSAATGGSVISQAVRPLMPPAPSGPSSADMVELSPQSHTHITCLFQGI